jgi:L-ascorbate metabolism protein UlaG (beta-lactamase superfamily)
MEIRWLGHSCFVIKGKEKTVITDPYHPDLGYSLGEPEADIVTLSHLHPGHSYAEGVANNPKQIKVPGEYEIGGVFITGIATFHDTEGGKTRGKNTVYSIEMDGMTLCHLGDLGHPLRPEMVDELGVIDILFLPVGEVSTIPVSIAVETVKELNPHIAIPMHYKTNVVARNLEPVDKFLKEMGIREAEPRSKLSVSESSLPSGTQVVVLNYFRD